MMSRSRAGSAPTRRTLRARGVEGRALHDVRRGRFDLRQWRLPVQANRGDQRRQATETFVATCSCLFSLKATRDCDACI